ncbi:MAG TPA: hypothetical protein VGC59_05450 [Solirubrobacteraceae bacterium]|jgi:hypothetical protein
MNTKTTATAADIQAQLRMLYVERALAELEGLASDPSYMEDLLDEIHEHRSAYVGTVVTEIATLRAELGAPLLG